MFLRPHQTVLTRYRPTCRRAAFMTGPPNKRQKREEYRKVQEAHDEQGSGKLELPKKRFYRQRAHANPFSDHHLTYPTCPAEMDWSSHYPAFFRAKRDNTTASSAALIPTAPHPTIADVGCGFGGLLIALSPLFPSDLILGLELRSQVLAYVHSRIAALRSQNPLPSPTNYQNLSALRTNTMKFLPQFCPRASLEKLFLCFPDPHFKARKHKARIVSSQLNAEYAYFVKPGGKVYTITDVEELHQWMCRHFEDDEAGDVKELWERVGEEELEADVCVKVMSEETEESKKVTRNGGRKFVAVFRRKDNPPWPEE